MRTYETLEVVPQTTRDRLAFIDFALMFKGETNRVEICRRFNVYPTQVTKDFVLYKQFAPDNIVYDSKLRMQVRGENFKPLFEYNVSKTLSSLSHGFGDGMDLMIESQLPIETPYLFNEPKLVIVSKLTEALYKKLPISMQYISLSSGESSREIVPHSIVNNGLRWHLRGFDRLTQEFRDFVLTRISSIKLLHNNSIEEYEKMEADSDWNDEITLELIPHPKIKYKKAIEQDYDMQDGKKILTVKVANADYLLRLWNVDCSRDASLKGDEFYLWLENNLDVAKRINLVLAPQ